MAIPFECQFEFGTHAVRTGYQYRLLIALGHLKQGAKAANTSQNTLAHGFLGQRLDAVDQGIASVNINASIAVREALGLGIRG